MNENNHAKNIKLCSEALEVLATKKAAAELAVDWAEGREAIAMLAHMRCAKEAEKAPSPLMTSTLEDSRATMHAASAAYDSAMERVSLINRKKQALTKKIIELHSVEVATFH